MRVTTIAWLGCLLLCAGLAAVFGFGRSYQAVLEPETGQAALVRIKADGWIADGAELHFGGLLARGNRVELHFRNWRPKGRETAHLQAFVCGALASDFRVAAGSRETVFLRGECEPRRLSFKVLNPFVSKRDGRPLGAQFDRIVVTSALGVPLLNQWYLLLGTAVLALLGLLIRNLIGGRWGWLCGLSAPWAGFELLRHSSFPAFDNLLALGSVCLFVLLGAWYYDRAGASDSDQISAVDPGFWSGLILALIILLAALLRFWGLNFGLPENFHPYEIPKLNAIMRMRSSGTLNPHYFLHPSLLLYAAYFFNQVLHTAGIFQGEWSSTVILAGRVASALAGVGSVGLVYLIGCRLLSRSGGLLAAAFLAVMPLHVTCSRYVKEDALLTFTALLCVWVFIKAWQEERRGLLLLAGLLAGCTASTKYSGLLLSAIFCAYPWLRSGSWRVDLRDLFWAAAALCLVPIGFALCTPYALVEFKFFLSQFNYEKLHMQKGHTSAIDAWSQLWMYHYSRSIWNGATGALALTALAGCGCLLRRGRSGALFLVGLILVFYIPAEFVKAKPMPQPDRYILPCLPFIALAAAGLIEILERGRRYLLFAFVLAAALVSPAVRSVNLATELKQDTRNRLEVWLRATLPAEAKLFVDWKWYEPPLKDAPFEVYFLDRGKILEELDLGKLVGPGPRYLLMSSLFYDRYLLQPNPVIFAQERIKGIFRELPVVAQLRPTYGSYGFHNPTITVLSLDQEEVAQHKQRCRERVRTDINYRCNSELNLFP